MSRLTEGQRADCVHWLLDLRFDLDERYDLLWVGELAPWRAHVPYTRTPHDRLYASLEVLDRTDRPQLLAAFFWHAWQASRSDEPAARALADFARILDGRLPTSESPAEVTSVDGRFSGSNSTDPLDRLIGRRLAGKYEIKRKLGQGGFGAVFEALQHPIARRVALKVNMHSGKADLDARFVREAQAQARIRHPACVLLLDFGRTPNGLSYLVQEFVSGRSLKELLADAPDGLPPDYAVSIVGQVLDALSAAHRHGIVHRDIKPANIMISDDEPGEEVRVLDFGIAKLLEVEGEGLTKTGAPLGTPLYMAPEQVRGGKISPQTDLYAVGAMFHHLVTGKPPFPGPGLHSILRQHLQEAPPGLPDGLRHLGDVVQRAMAKEPADRFSSASKMKAALFAATAVGARGAAPYEQGSTEWKHLRNFLLVLVPLLLFGLAYVFTTGSDPDPPAPPPDIRGDGPPPPVDTLATDDQTDMPALPLDGPIDVGPAPGPEPKPGPDRGRPSLTVEDLVKRAEGHLRACRCRAALRYVKVLERRSGVYPQFEAGRLRTEHGDRCVSVLGPCK